MTQTISVKEALDKIRVGDAILIDVREADEFKAEHVAHALSIPLSTLEGGFQMLDIPKDKIILFQCVKGSRGQTASERIHNLGLCQNTIMNIEGGIEAWKKANLPVVSTNLSSPKLSIIRQVQIIIGLVIAISVLLGVLGFGFAFAIAGFFGAALFFAGLTGWCGLAIWLSKMPWNK
jgi:rhodanese-related sulfurtransferase